MSNQKDWKQFEIAVADFVSALDPDANVRHDVRLPDKDTGHLRQRDVWVEARVCQLFPIKMLISCKHWNRKLDEQDIDAFIGELRSSGAQKGVIYSFSGFTQPAIEKAKVLDICCCNLYDNQSPDIPESLWFSVYCCTQTFQITLMELPDKAWGIHTFDDLFAIRLPSDHGEIELIDHLASLYNKGGREAASKIMDSLQFPKPWWITTEISIEERDELLPLKIVVAGNWRVYRGRMEAHLLKGSYSFTSDEFFGSQTSPLIDMKGSAPGPGWEFIENPPEKIDLGMAVFVLTDGKFREVAIREMGSLKIENSA